ncbi:MAG: recombinase family protein, partial [Clostridia bacterium]
MKTAVIYARYSSDRQTEQSIDGQLRVCNEYAERNDIVIMDTYIDRAMTGTNDNRAAFQQMLKDSSKRAWNYV